TEPQAGSDVGALTTKAVRKDDGTFAIEGSKIFITNGEQDVGENIVHVVLARIEGDAPGTKGLSTFIVPKYCVNEDGSTGDSNNVTCTGIEHKMGLHGSPTTSLSFGDKGECIGYLLGKEQEGIRIMFHMMNSSRLEVGIWGQGISSASYLHALNYSKDRLQGQSLENPDPATQVSITKHPDIRRALLMMKSYTEGMRAMLYYCGYAMDQEVIAETEEERKNWSKVVSLLIPVCKAYPTEKSVEFALHAIQIYGGYGYTQEYPVEQFLRDSKVACIFEGTTGIQGMDLALRKLGMGKGKVFADFLSGMDEMADKAKKIPELEKYTAQFMKTKAALAEIPSVFAEYAGKGESVYSFLQATPLIEAVGDVMVAW
ncbi:MAG: acyl-CoA dehydrogenase, partial [bacterium]|nr:acyl-CoA dehydrogenase [bacterium]